MIGKVKVLGTELTVAKSTALDDHGMYDSAKAVVYIRADLERGVERHSFLHELAHDWLFRNGFENELDKPQVERLCDTFAIYVRDLVCNNPRLIEYVKGK